MSSVLCWVLRNTSTIVPFSAFYNFVFQYGIGCFRSYYSSSYFSFYSADSPDLTLLLLLFFLIWFCFVSLLLTWGKDYLMEKKSLKRIINVSKILNFSITFLFRKRMFIHMCSEYAAVWWPFSPWNSWDVCWAFLFSQRFQWCVSNAIGWF